MSLRQQLVPTKFRNVSSRSEFSKASSKASETPRHLLSPGPEETTAEPTVRDKEEVRLWISELMTLISHGRKMEAELMYARLAETAKLNKDAYAVQQIHSIMGDFYFKNNNIKHAIYHYENMKNLAEQSFAYRTKMKVYKKLGMCYQRLRKYDVAILYFKKMLEIALYLGSVKYEILSYNYISLQYYHKGDIEKAAYYHERMWRGSVESEDSSFRRNARTKMETKKKRKQGNDGAKRIEMDNFRVLLVSGDNPDESSYLNVSDISEPDIPSPRGNARNNEKIKSLPFTAAPINRSKSSKVPLMGMRRKFFSKSGPNSPAGLPLSASTARLEGVRPHMLLNHLSTSHNLKNYYFIEQQKQVRVRNKSTKV